jgi:hypothetical protein
MIFSFGQLEQQRIEVDVLGYERPASGNDWDDNLLAVAIHVRAGGFCGETSATVITSELNNFLLELRSLHASLSGLARFQTMDGRLSFGLAGDGKGHIEVRGEVKDEHGVGNRLHFKLRFDQSQLGTSIRELEQVTLQFPVRAA